MNSKTTAQPVKTYQNPVGSTDLAWARPGMFIECRDPTPPVLVSPARPRERSAVDERFHYRVLDVAHDAMVTAPKALTELLLEVVV